MHIVSSLIIIIKLVKSCKKVSSMWKNKKIKKNIKENFYVDDGLKSVPTDPEAIEFIRNSTEMCLKGGFGLHKFTSNSKEVVESTPTESHAKDIKELD